MGKITINGKTWNLSGGANISIHSNSIYVNGEKLDESKDILNAHIIKIEGNVNNIDTDKSVDCDNVGGNINASGSVNCDDVKGDVHAGGSVNCDDISGNVFAGGSVNCN